MSQRDGLSPLELQFGSDAVTTAQALAADFLSKRKNLHGTATMRLNEGGDGTDGEDDGDADKDGGNTGGAGGDDKNSSGGNPDAKITALEEEKNRHFTARQAAEQERDALKAEKEERDRANNDEVTNLKNDVEKYKGEVQELSSRLESALLDNAFLTDNSFEWHNPKMVLRNIDRENVTIDKDGKVTGVDAAIKKLAEDNPWMLKSEPGKGDKDDKGDAGNDGNPSGSQRNGKKGNQEVKHPPKDLRAKYPALRR